MNLDLTTILKQLASDYLSVLHNPKNSKTGFVPSNTILLHHADDEMLEKSRKLLQEFFNNQNESINIITPKEIDPSKNHHYRIDIGYFLENLPKNY